MKQFSFFRSLLVAASLISSALAFSSCSDDNDSPSGAYAEDGVFVINEGSFTHTNGSISYYNQSTQQVQHGIFGKENNGQLLGDVIQDMVLYGDRAFIVANNSNKIEVVNAATFKSVGVVEGLALPRYFAVLNEEKGYVTEYVDYVTGRVSVIDLKTYTVTNTIPVGALPEQLLIADGKLYVANGGNNTVTVINTATDAVEKTLTVADAPNSLALDRNNDLWVLSSGNKAYDPYPVVDAANSTAGALTKISTSTSAIARVIDFPDVSASAGELTLNGSKDKLYFVYGNGVHQLDISATALSPTPLISRSFYGLGVDPDNGHIYGGDEGAWAEGTVHIYKPDGTKVSEFKAGIGPNGFVFN